MENQRDCTTRRAAARRRRPSELGACRARRVARRRRPVSRARLTRLLARERRAAVRRLRDVLAALLRATAVAGILEGIRREPGAEQSRAVVRDGRARRRRVRRRLRLRSVEPPPADDGFAHRFVAAHARRRIRAALASTADPARAHGARARRRARRRDGVSRRRSAPGRARTRDGALCRRHRDRRDGGARDHRHSHRPVLVAHRGGRDRRARPRVDARVPHAAAAVAPFRAAPR